MQLNNLEHRIMDIARRIRSNSLGIQGNRSTSLGLLMSVWEAKCLGIDQIDVIELGVASGNGLLSLINHTDLYRNEFDIEFTITGFDIGSGMPPPTDYRDHPELWQSGDFQFNVESVLEKINGRADLIIGDVKDTVPQFCKDFSGTLGFVSVDLDQYVSTTNAMSLFLMDADRYLPAMPCYFDDVDVSFFYNPYCGEELAINEFNQRNAFRKVCKKSDIYNIPNLYALHVLDHPVCTGKKTPKYPLSLQPFQR
jgi:hypothetical protein